MDPRSVRVFARLMARELSDEELDLVAGGPVIVCDTSETCFFTISGSPRRRDDSGTD